MVNPVSKLTVKRAADILAQRAERARRARPIKAAAGPIDAMRAYASKLGIPSAASYGLGGAAVGGLGGLAMSQLGDEEQKRHPWQDALTGAIAGGALGAGGRMLYQGTHPEPNADSARLPGKNGEPGPTVESGINTVKDFDQQNSLWNRGVNALTHKTFWGGAAGGGLGEAAYLNARRNFGTPSDLVRGFHRRGWENLRHPGVLRAGHAAMGQIKGPEESAAGIPPANKSPVPSGTPDPVVAPRTVPSNEQLLHQQLGAMPYDHVLQDYQAAVYGRKPGYFMPTKDDFTDALQDRIRSGTVYGPTLDALEKNNPGQYRGLLATVAGGARDSHRNLSGDFIRPTPEVYEDGVIAHGLPGYRQNVRGLSNEGVALENMVKTNPLGPFGGQSRPYFPPAEAEGFPGMIGKGIRGVGYGLLPMLTGAAAQYWVGPSAVTPETSAAIDRLGPDAVARIQRLMQPAPAGGPGQ